jgi:hypothetical protein
VTRTKPQPINQKKGTIKENSKLRQIETRRDEDNSEEMTKVRASVTNSPATSVVQVGKSNMLFQMPNAAVTDSQ